MSEETTERELMRLLHGELPEARARVLRERLSREPTLAATYRRLEATWGSLELPPPEPAGAAFRAAVMARIQEEAAGPAASWSAAPLWVRAAAPVALAAGLAAGALLGTFWTSPDGSLGLAQTTLAEGYWEVMEGVEP